MPWNTHVEGSNHPNQVIVKLPVEILYLRFGLYSDFHPDQTQDLSNMTKSSQHRSKETWQCQAREIHQMYSTVFETTKKKRSKSTTVVLSFGYKESSPPLPSTIRNLIWINTKSDGKAKPNIHERKCQTLPVFDLTNNFWISWPVFYRRFRSHLIYILELSIEFDHGLMKRCVSAYRVDNE